MTKLRNLACRRTIASRYSDDEGAAAQHCRLYLQPLEPEDHHHHHHTHHHDAFAAGHHLAPRQRIRARMSGGWCCCERLPGTNPSAGHWMGKRITFRVPWERPQVS